MASEEIRQKEKELHSMKVEYMEERPKCENTGCIFYSTHHTNHCSWTVFHDECRDYKPE